VSEAASATAHQLAVALAELTDAFAPITEAVEGYRQQWVAIGYTPDEARAMAVDYHHVVLTQLANAKPT